MTLRPDGQQAEKVIIRRRQSAALLQGVGEEVGIVGTDGRAPAGSPLARHHNHQRGRATSAVHVNPSSLGEFKQVAFKSGLLGGLLGGVAAISVLLLAGLIRAGINGSNETVRRS